MGIAIDQKGSQALTSTEGGTARFSVSTTSEAEVFVIAAEIAATSTGITSIADTMGLNFQRLGINSTQNPSLDIWWAVVPGLLANDAVTVTIGNNTVAWSVDWFTVSGANYSGVIFDPLMGPGNIGGSIKFASAANSLLAPSVTAVTTNNANDMMIGICAINSALTETAGTGYTLINTINQTGESGASEEQVFSSIQSGVTVAFGSAPVNPVNWTMGVFAIEQAAQVPTKQPDSYSGIYAVSNWLLQTARNLGTMIDAVNSAAQCPPGPVIPPTRIPESYTVIYEVEDYLAIQAKNYPTNETVQPPSFAIRPPSEVSEALPWSYMMHHALDGYLSSQRTRGYPSNLTVQAPIVIVIPSGYFAPDVFPPRTLEAVLGYLAELQKKYPSNLTVQAPFSTSVFPVMDPTWSYTMPRSIDAYVSELQKLGYPTNETVEVVAIPDISAIYEPSYQIYTVRPEIIEYLQDLRKRYPTDETVQAVSGWLTLGLRLRVGMLEVQKGNARLTLGKGYAQPTVNSS